MSNISITAASVLKSANASITTGITAAGVTITQGQYLYMLANGTMGLADSNGTPPATGINGVYVALNASSPGQPIDYINADTAFVFGGTAASGDFIYLSNTAGAITSTYADIASGSLVVFIGVINTDLTMNFRPVIGGVK